MDKGQKSPGLLGDGSRRGTSAHRRPVERPRLAVTDRDEQPDVAEPGGKVVGVVRGPDITVALRVAPQRTWGRSSRTMASPRAPGRR